ncbi:hypothetical protein QCA50_004664 [Cerrena zonata]|uniref:Uncharacterized protein n=1 Tax=Cerrena zonata TaxID=2478898 RepID=A0AAW0GES3_9APHY
MAHSFLQLDELVSIISTSVENIKAEYSLFGDGIPTLDDVQLHSLDTKHTSENLQRATLSIQRACAQLLTLVAPPQRTLTMRAMDIDDNSSPAAQSFTCDLRSYTMAAALIVVQTNV